MECAQNGDLAQCIGVAVVDLAQVDIRTIMVVHGLSAAFCIEDAVHIGAVLDRKVLCSISLCCRVCFHFGAAKVCIPRCKHAKLGAAGQHQQGHIVVLGSSKALFGQHHPITVQVREDAHADTCIAHQRAQTGGV